VDPEEIARIKFFHRPSANRQGSRVVFGCSCGAEIHPCETLTAALAEERVASGDDAANGEGPADKEDHGAQP
jgi:hypothetical protein